MTSSARSSAACGRRGPATEAAAAATAGIPWRPSRWLLAVVGLMTCAAPLAVLASEMPAPAARPLAAAALLYGAWALRREARRPRATFRFPADGRVEVDGRPAADFALAWRGPLAFASWRDARGRRQRRVWWPDTLPPPLRRELRLAAPERRAARAGASMAP